MEKSVSKTKARRRFIILYLVSLVFIFIVVSSFWKVSAPSVAQTVTETNDDASRFMQIDTLLHARMEALDTSILQYAKTKGSEDLATVQRHVYFLQSAIDSVDKQAAILLDGSRKQHMLLAVANFKKLMAERNCVLYGGETTQVLIPPPAGQTPPVSTNTDGDQDKDQLILSLQNQLKQTEAALQQKTNNASQPAGESDSEWKQKYASLKTAFEKTAASEKALKAAYKTVAEDNRRLLNQLQTLRAEKKN